MPSRVFAAMVAGARCGDFLARRHGSQSENTVHEQSRQASAITTAARLRFRGFRAEAATLSRGETRLESASRFAISDISASRSSLRFAVR